MDVTSRLDGPSVVAPGDFTRGGKVMKHDVLAAVEDGLAGVVRLGRFYEFADQGVPPGLDWELLFVRCAEWYYRPPASREVEHALLRVVVELARPGVPFASVSVFTVQGRGSSDDKLIVAHDGDDDPKQCLLRRRFSSTFSALDTSHLPSNATVGRAYTQLLKFVDALLITL
jgi:hypothetical protein